MPFHSNKIFLYIVILVCILIFYTIMQKIRAAVETKRQQRQWLWEQLQLEELEKKKAAETETKRYNNAQITLNNPFLLNLTNKSRIILFAGEPGNGKSLTMDAVGKWLYDRQQWLDKKRYKYNLYMRPEYLKEQQRLLDEDLMNVYDNLGMTLGKLQTQEVLPAIKMLKRVSERAILMLDEAGHYFPKERYFELLKTKDLALKAEYERLIEFVRFIRHYINGYLLLTEQDEENIFIGVRRTGYARVKCLGTWVYLTKRGKRSVAFKKFFNDWLPGLFYKPVQAICGKRKTLDKIKTAFKLFLPNKFNNFIYFENGDKIDSAAAKKYIEYKVLLEHEKKQQYLIFNNNNIFTYDTRSKRPEYAKFFKNKTQEA